MATLSAMGCSRAAFTAAPSASTIRDSGLLLGLPNCRKSAPWSSSSRCRAANAGRRFSSVGIRASLKVDKVGADGADKIQPVEMQEDSSGFYEKALLTAAIALMPLVDAQVASAAGGEFGLLEGRSFALIHPLVMGGLLVYTLYAGYLGWQWRRVRTIQTDINELKKEVQQVPVAAGGKSAPPPPPSPVEAQIKSLTEERKELVKGGFRDRHFNAGSILLGLGVFESVGGAVNTWLRTGKLFPGPHLFAGAGITICWALAAALVPSMQKGNETARNLHIGLNLINVGLFVWQIPTGLEIVLKVFEFTTWP